MNIQICPVCTGNGYTTENDRYDGYISHNCKRCEGTGRIMTRTYSFDVPFGTDMNKIYPIDNQIIEWIRLIPTMINKSEPEVKRGGFGEKNISVSN
jgi:hypothetical protein